MNYQILITLRNGGKLKAIEETLYEKNGYNVRYFGENGKYYNPSDIVSILPIDKGKQIYEKDFCYQMQIRHIERLELELRQRQEADSVKHLKDFNYDDERKTE